MLDIYNSTNKLKVIPIQEFKIVTRGKWKWFLFTIVQWGKWKWCVFTSLLVTPLVQTIRDWRCRRGDFSFRQQPPQQSVEQNLTQKCCKNGKSEYKFNNVFYFGSKIRYTRTKRPEIKATKKQAFYFQVILDYLWYTIILFCPA